MFFGRLLGRHSDISLRRQSFPYILWLLVFLAMPIWVSHQRPGWDAEVIVRAMRASAAGRDPYADDIEAEEKFHNRPPVAADATPPFSYVYPPLTLPLLRILSRFPLRLLETSYWLVYVAAILGQVWAGFWSVERSEQSFFLTLAPLAAFFPGLLADGTVLSGNLAPICYAAAVLTSIRGWRSNRWNWFYLAVLAASCIKPPFLSLLAIPVLSAKRQWIPAGLTAACGLFLFAIQPLLWPALFHNYTHSIQLMFTYDHDFGSSPSGLLGDALLSRGLAYYPASLVFYLCYATPIFVLLLILSRRYHHGVFPLTRWVPVLLTGVLLLNPRLVEYDTAPLFFPLALIGWRFLHARLESRASLICAALFIVPLNAAALINWHIHKLVSGPLLVFSFMIGCWELLYPLGETETLADDTVVAERSLALN